MSTSAEMFADFSRIFSNISMDQKDCNNNAGTSQKLPKSAHVGYHIRQISENFKNKILAKFIVHHSMILGD